jgi:hypothetical protein
LDEESEREEYSLASHQSITSYATLGESTPTDLPQFKVHVRLLVTRKLVLEQKENGEWDFYVV